MSSTSTEKYPLIIVTKNYSSVSATDGRNDLKNISNAKIDSLVPENKKQEPEKHDDDTVMTKSRVGTIDFPGGTPISTPDLNEYQQKKTLAKGMMDLALFSANANQLRYIMDSLNQHPYFYPTVVLISFSIFLQVAIGVGLVWNALYNVKNEKEICIANKINNFTIVGIFLVTVVNVFICSFGVSSPAPVT